MSPEDSTHSNLSVPSPEETEHPQDQKLWDLLEQTKSQPVSPLFSRNIIREIRLEQNKPNPKKFLSKLISNPKLIIPGIATSIAGLAAITFFLSHLSHSPSSLPSKNSGTVQNEENSISSEAISSVEGSLESELLLAAADEPELFSDEEVFAMLF